MYRLVLVSVMLLVHTAALAAQQATSRPARADSVAPMRPEVARVLPPEPVLIARVEARPAAKAAGDGGAAQPRTDPKQEAPDRWKVSAEFSFTDQSGKKDLRLLTGGLKLAHREKKRFELDGSLQSRYGRSGDEVVARNDYASMSFGIPRGEHWHPAPFLHFNAERDELRRLDLRFSSGAGIRLMPYQVAKQGEGTVSLALLYSYENLVATAQSPQRETRHNARWNLQVRGTQEVGSGVSLQHVSTYEPVWGEMADYLLRSDTGAKVMLTERLALSIGYQLHRTNRPPEGVEPDDRLFKTGLIIDF